MSNCAALGVSPGAHAAYEQIYFSSLMPRTYLSALLLETLVRASERQEYNCR